MKGKKDDGGKKDGKNDDGKKDGMNSSKNGNMSMSFSMNGNDFNNTMSS